MTTTRNPPLTPRLRQSGSGMHGKTLPAHKMRLILGRGTTADVVLSDDGASRAHACIAWNGQAWSIEDLGSRNGTKVNEDVVRGNRPLRDGDRIRIGKTELVFELQASPTVVSATDRGSRIDNCTLLERIDSGSTGEVWRVKDDSNRERALKIIRSSLAANPEAVQIFLEGGRAQMRLLHPNVLPIHAVTPGARPVIVMALAKRSLAGWLSEHRTLAPSVCLVLAKSVASALHSASQAGLIHRALHPGNILLDEHDRPLVTDFALLGAEAPLSARKAQAPWLAPEEVTGGECDNLSNQCRLGLILWHALTGIVPYAGVDPLSVARARLTGQLTGLDRVANLPDALPHLLSRMLCRDPHQRFSDWLDLQRAVERIEAGGEMAEVRQDSLLRLPMPSEHTRVSRRSKAQPPSEAGTPSEQAVKSTERIHPGGTSSRSRTIRRPARSRLLTPANTLSLVLVLIALAVAWQYLHHHPAVVSVAKQRLADVAESTHDEAATPAPVDTTILPARSANDHTIRHVTSLATSLPSLAPDSAATPYGPVSVRGEKATDGTSVVAAPTQAASAPAEPSSPVAAPLPPAIAGPPSSAAPTLAGTTASMPPLHVQVLLSTLIGGDGDQAITAVTFDDQGRLTASGTGFSAVVNPRTGTAAIHGNISNHATVTRVLAPPLWNRPLTLALGGGHGITIAQRQDQGQRLPALGNGSWSWWALDASQANALGLGSDALISAVFARPDQRFVTVAWAEGANSCLARDPRDAKKPLALPAHRRPAQDAATYVFLGNGLDGSTLGSFVLSGTAIAATCDPWGRIFLSSADRGRDHLDLAGDAGLCILSPDLSQVLCDVHLGGRVAADGGWEQFTCIAYHDGLLALGGSTTAHELTAHNALQRKPGGGQDGLLVVLQLWDDAANSAHDR